MNNSQLAIDLSNAGVRFSEFSKGVISTHELLFKDRQEFRYREILDDFVSSTGIKNRDYDDYSLSWSMERSTLVPSNIFGESNSVDLFHLCYGKGIPNGQIDYNRIPEQGVVNIFEIADWVKSYIVTRFPRTIMQHEGSHLIRGLFSEPTFKLHALIVPYNSYFQLIMAKENKLIYYSTFDYQEIEDVIYHLAFTLQQKELMNTEGRLTVARGIGSPIDFPEQLIDRSSKFHDLRQLTVNIDPHFITNAQRLCV